MNSIFQNFISYARGISEGLKSLPRFNLSALRKVFSFMGRREKIAISILLGLAILNLVFVCRNFYLTHTVPVSAYGGVYTEGMTGQPAYINPLLAYTEQDLTLTKLVFSGLYKYDGSGLLVPDLAEGQPIISEDQKQYIVNLRKDVKWHNDRIFTADDVVFTIQSLQDPAYKSPLRSQWMSTTVEKISDSQVRFTTKDVSGPFVHNLTLPILPQNLWQRVDPSAFVTSPGNLQAVGTGPYTIKEIKKQASGRVDEITLDSFSNYYAGKPKIDTLVIKFYESGDDLLNALHSGEIAGFGFASLDRNIFVNSDAGMQVLQIPMPQYQVLFFNVKNSILSSQSVRQALSQAVNRQGIVDNVFKGAARLPASPFAAGTTDSVIYNTNTAAAMLDTAGWIIDPKTNFRTKKGVVLEITISTNDSLLNSKTAEAIAETWRTIGVKVNLTVLPSKQLTDTLIRPRTFDVLVFQQKFGADPDPFAFWHSSQAKDPGVNLTGFADPQADKLISEARASTNSHIRQEKYRTFNDLLAKQMPALFLNQTLYMYVLTSDIKNITLTSLYDASGHLQDASNWYMQEGRRWGK